ncbi:MAG: Maf family protein [Pseudomonadota bacterium]
MQTLPIILASASPARLELLSRIDIHPIVKPADVDETELPRELPGQAASRLATLKANKISQEIEGGYIIAADTVAAVGRRIMPKALTPEMVADCLKLYSGRRHRIYTGVHIIKKTEDGTRESRSRLVQTVVAFKRLTDQEIDWYANCGEGIGKAGGYSVQGSVQGFVSFISGSFSNIIGLPLFETRNMLISLGYK